MLVCETRRNPSAGRARPRGRMFVLVWVTGGGACGGARASESIERASQARRAGAGLHLDLERRRGERGRGGGHGRDGELRILARVARADHAEDL